VQKYVQLCEGCTHIYVYMCVYIYVNVVMIVTVVSEEDQDALRSYSPS
jgi:hypothetical protein